MSEYLSMGDTGGESGVTWNSTKAPGTCKPSDFSTLAKFKALQEQMNRVAKMKGFPTIAVDGDLGPGTVSLFNKILGGNAACGNIAGYVSTYTAQFNALASSLGAPASVPAPKPTTAPAIVNAAGATVPAPPGASNPMVASVYDAFGGSPVLAVAGVAIVGGIAYLLLKKKKRR